MRVWSCSSTVTLIFAVGLCSSLAAAAPAPDKVIARIDLSKPFHLPPGASFTATQGDPIQDSIGDQQPGAIRLCITASGAGSCADLNRSFPESRYPSLETDLRYHYLETADIVFPRGSSAPPLLHIQEATLHAPNNSQAHLALMLAYRRSNHQFEPVFEQEVGGNHNQEIRYITSGPLRGDIISAEPTENAPYGYWVTVNELTPGYHYRQVLRYRSATHYGDGNPLAVIDSEMPNILRGLGLWRPGQPLPVKSGCAKPHLVKSELWCS